MFANNQFSTLVINYQHYKDDSFMEMEFIFLIKSTRNILN